MIKEMRLLCDYLLNKLIVVKTYISNLVFFSEVFTGNHGYTTHKTNKNKHTTKIAKRMSNTDPTKTPGVNEGAS
jgi:hypothetical protein